MGSWNVCMQRSFKFCQDRDVVTNKLVQPFVVFAYNCAYHVGTIFSPFYVMFLREPRVSLDLALNPFATSDAYMRQLFHCLQWYAGSERVNLDDYIVLTTPSIMPMLMNIPIPRNGEWSGLVRSSERPPTCNLILICAWWFSSLTLEFVGIWFDTMACFGTKMDHSLSCLHRNWTIGNKKLNCSRWIQNNGLPEGWKWTRRTLKPWRTCSWNWRRLPQTLHQEGLPRPE